MTCSRCGADNPGGAAACSQCGTSLVPPPPPPGSQAPPPPPPGQWSPPQQGWEHSGQQWAPPGQQGYGGQPGYGAPPVQVPNYLVQSILLTLFCCLPFGIVAIVFSSQANSKAALGDYQGAMASANTAKTWCWAAFGVGLSAVVLWIAVVSTSYNNSF